MHVNSVDAFNYMSARKSLKQDRYGLIFPTIFSGKYGFFAYSSSQGFAHPHIASTAETMLLSTLIGLYRKHESEELISRKLPVRREPSARGSWDILEVSLVDTICRTIKRFH